MMYHLTEIDQLLIEKYLDKTLTYNELTTFNQRLTDADFAAEVQQYERAVVAIKAFGDDKLKALLQAEEATLQAEKEIKLKQNKDAIRTIGTPQYKIEKTRFLMQRWAIAASILAVVSASVFYFMDKNETPKTETTATVFTPYRNYERPTVRDNAPKNDLEKAFSLYDNGEFEAALRYFEKIETPQYNAQFLQANAYLATHQSEKAVPILTRLSQSNDADWQPKSEWYLALALAEKQADKARPLLEKIKNTPAHPFQKQAADKLLLLK